MSRTLAIILTIIFGLLCGCPGLASIALAALVSTQNVIDAAQQSGVDLSTYGGVDSATMVIRIVFIVLALILIAIPVIVALVTFFLARKKASNTYVQ